ncbi:MAG: ATP-dependent helicase [Catonella sp.]|uniref:ATP-dependent helicase n=1 Tax=Catonella sp. TaxID=2382125 RepID=UPI003F9F530A
MNILDNLNPEQRKAVVHENGPLLILAGAGSGKTRVLTRRIAYLIKEYGVSPWNILALTFTNKAAKEMRERVNELLNEEAGDIWVSTFHSACVKMLRRFIDKIGYDRRFNIYDTDDTKAVIKQVLKSLNIDSKKFSEKTCLNIISNAKNDFIDAEKFAANSSFGADKDVFARVYLEYEKRMKNNNALDFDDILVKTVELLQTDVDTLEYYQRRFRYILVDEYQDTNIVQFKLLKMLANFVNEDGEIENNLCVVGDDDQSIYKFRGADIRNILNFEKIYPSCLVIKLEENYRSTGNILEAANGVISNNTMRKDKKLWTSKEGGASLSYKTYDTGDREAEGVTNIIRRTVEAGKADYSDIAVLYRTNAQSRAVEEKLVYDNIPYKLYGGTNFYSRREIKDILAYLKVINNPKDDTQVRRILNVPKRGIGSTTEDRIADYAVEKDISFFEACMRVGAIPGLSRAVTKVEKFVAYVEAKIREFSETKNLKNEIETLIEEIEYIEGLRLENTDEARGRIDNIYELINKVAVFELGKQDEGSAKLADFLAEVSLLTDADNKDSDNKDMNKVTLMTLHSAKGLEFKIVFIVGMEEGLFPGRMSLYAEDESELEEERRLCYVGITRAMEKLYLSNAKMRMIRGERQWNKPSRFISEIPEHLLSRARFQNNEGPVSIFKTPSSASEKNGLFAENPYISKGFKQVPNKSDSVEIGDMVSHIKFGEGEVIDVSKGDGIVSVRFKNDTYGVRKFKLGLAGLKKIN